jgi:3-hydroxyacyl-[acyl-carrier-protein] dehydratase
MNKELSKKIISKLPYGEGFLFVDEITFVDENRITGNYTFRADAPYYKWHFKHRPVTPGVLLIECAGQIAMSCHVIYLERAYEYKSIISTIMQYCEVNFLQEISPGDMLVVESEKIYYRHGVLKSKIILKNSNKEVCATGFGQVKFVKDE